MKTNTMWMRSVPAVLLIMWLSLPQNANGQAAGASPVESITESELMDHIYFLASDYMGGRIATGPEYEIAAHYVATQFAAGGVEPLDSDKGNMNGYFQEVPYEKLVLGEEVTWVLQSGDGMKTFKRAEDFKIIEEGKFIPETPLDVVFAGYGIHEPDHGWDDFEGIDIEGKMVLILSGAPLKNGEAVLPDSIHKQYSSIMGIQKKALPLIERGPAAILLILDRQTSAVMPFNLIPSMLSGELYQYLGTGEEYGDLRIPMIYLAKEEVIRSVFEGQKYDPVNIEEEGIRRYRTYQLEDLTLETRFPVLERSEIHLKNVVGIVPGTDPDLSQEYITVGAHLDHVAFPTGQVANGADDNASGSAGMMEIAEAVALDPPRRSVVFIAYTAEEMGLQGSHYFVNAGPLDITDIRFNVNLDMIGRTTNENMEARSHYLIGESIYESRLVPFISAINDATIRQPLIPDFHHLTPGSSDHVSYSDAGIPSFTFCSGDHTDYHRPGDDPEKIEYDKAARISRLAYLITMELANMDEVPQFLE